MRTPSRAFWLRWASYVAETDVRPAFRNLTRLLDVAHGPVHVIVDLRNDPRLPLQTTISETMSGPFMHRNMGRWLVIGSNNRAAIIAAVITKVGRIDSIFWFETEEEALAHLATLEGEQVPAWG